MRLGLMLFESLTFTSPPARTTILASGPRAENEEQMVMILGGITALLTATQINIPSVDETCQVFGVV